MTQPGPLHWLALCAALGCSTASVDPARGPLAIDEVMTDNDSAWLDDADEVEDWIELRNISSEPVQLHDYALRDGRGRSFQLPEQSLPAGAVLVLFADDDADQGPLHMPWKLGAEGVTLELIDRADVIVDRVEVPALGVNEAYARPANKD